MSKGPFPKSLPTCRRIQSPLESIQALVLILGWGKAKCLGWGDDSCGFLAAVCAEFNMLDSFQLWKVCVCVIGFRSWCLDWYMSASSSLKEKSALSLNQLLAQNTLFKEGLLSRTFLLWDAQLKPSALVFKYLSVLDGNCGC